MLNNVNENVVSFVEVSDGNESLVCLDMALVKNALFGDLLAEVHLLENQWQNLVSCFQGLKPEVNHLVQQLINQDEVFSHRVLRESPAEIMNHGLDPQDLPYHV